jgi:hypothetical protein
MDLQDVERIVIPGLLAQRSDLLAAMEMSRPGLSIHIPFHGPTMLMCQNDPGGCSLVPGKLANVAERHVL